MARIWNTPVFILGTMYFIVDGVFSYVTRPITAWIAKKSELLNGGLSAFLCVSFALYAIATGKQNEPLWLAIVLLPLSPR